MLMYFYKNTLEVARAADLAYQMSGLRITLKNLETFNVSKSEQSLLIWTF